MRAKWRREVPTRRGNAVWIWMACSSQHSALSTQHFSHAGSMLLHGRVDSSPSARNDKSYVSIDHPAGDWGVAFDAAIAQEGPVTANFFHGFQVHLAHQDLFFVRRSLYDHAATRIAEERLSPELEACSRSFVAADVSVFESDAVYDSHKHPVGDRMCALDGAPGIVLCGAPLFFF